MPYVVYANPFPTFQPAYRLVTAITNALVPTVTTSFAHQYKTGLIVRFYIPTACGMQQLVRPLNFIFPVYTITVTSPTTFTIPIDTTNFDQFLIPVSTNPHIDIGAQVVPVGEDSSILTEATNNVLPYSAT